MEILRCEVKYPAIVSGTQSALDVRVLASCIPLFDIGSTWKHDICHASVKAVIYAHSMYIFGGWDGHDTLQEGCWDVP